MAQLFDPGQIGVNILSAFKQGQQERRQNDYRNALSGYAMNPTEEGLGAIAPHNPEFVMAERGRMQQAQQAQRKEQRDMLPIMGRLLDTVQDEASYQQARVLAQRAGIDVSQVPPNFDPNWVNETKTLVKAIQTPQGQEILSAAGKQAYDEGLRPGDGRFEARVTEIFNTEQIKTIPYQPGGNVITFDPRTGTVKPLVQGQSVAQPMPYNPNDWEPVEGGAGGNASGGFPGN